jgi:hypothetical protein
MTVRLTTDLAGLNRLIDQLGTDVEAAARPAAQAAAQVFYDGVVANVDALGTVTGNLRRAIYQAFSPENSGPGRASYNVSWNERKAPHGHLVEYGHVQRYVVYLNKKGEWKTKIRPEMLGKKKPSRRASQAVKDAYYVPLASPKQVAAKPFVRPAFALADRASAAAESMLLKKLGAL